MFCCRGIKRRHFRRRPRRDGGGQRYRDVLDVRAPSGSVLRQSLDRISALRQDPRPQQAGQNSRDLLEEVAGAREAHEADSRRRHQGRATRGSRRRRGRSVSFI